MRSKILKNKSNSYSRIEYLVRIGHTINSNQFGISVVNI